MVNIKSRLNKWFVPFILIYICGILIINPTYTFPICGQFGFKIIINRFVITFIIYYGWYATLAIIFGNAFTGAFRRIKISVNKLITDLTYFPSIELKMEFNFTICAVKILITNLIRVFLRLAARRSSLFSIRFIIRYLFPKKIPAKVFLKKV